MGAGDGCAGLLGQILELADLLRIAFGEGSAENGESLREDIDEAAFHAAVSCDEPVAGDDLLIHAEIAAAMGDQLVEFLEGVLVEQQFDALAGAKFSFLVLSGAALRTSTLFGGFMAEA